MSQNMNHTTPPGRLVRGSLYKGNTTDAENKPLVTKTGPNTGQPRVDYYFALAIPKGAEQHWSQTEWGQKILQVGATAFPQAYQSPAFAWKITDGDSQTPNKRGKKPCDNEGYRGHWVLAFSSGFAPRLYKTRPGTRDQFDPIPEPDAVKLGYWVQVNFNAGGNGSQTQPGVFLNHSMVCLVGYDKEIVVGPDVASAGFGMAALPSHVSMTPPAGMFGAVAPAMGAPGMPGLPGAAPAFGAPAGFPQMAAAAPLLPGVAGAGGFPQMGAPALPMGAPAMGLPPMMQAAAPAPAAYTMTAAAGVHTQAQYNQQGYTDEWLLQNGYMVPAAPAMGMPQMAAPALPGLAPGFSAPGQPGYAAPIAGAPGAQIPVIPNPAFLQVPANGMPAGGMPPMMQAAPAMRQMTPKAQGMTQQQLNQQGYPDDWLIQNGFMI